MATIRAMRGKWQAIVRRKGHPQISQTFELKKNAEKWARQQELKMDSGQWADRTEAEQTTFGELLGRYANQISGAKGGSEIEKIRLNAIKRSQLAKYSVASVTSKMVAQWRDQRLTQVSGSTVSREMTLLSHVFSVAIREWSFPLNHNPVSQVRKPTVAQPRDRVLNETERDRLIAECAKCRNPWVKPVVVFALETAARRGEILSLSWDGVDLQRRIAKVSGKTGTRTVPLSPSCVDMLSTIQQSLDGLVFPVSIQALKQAYERAVTRADIDNFTFHDLRHDALTRLAKLGFNVLELRAISGHTTANMLQRYVSIDACDLAGRMVTPLT